MNYFITAIGTDSGKTVASAIIAQALKADYWKPVQAGYPTDSDTIRSICPNLTVHPETFILKTPASPHVAAAVENMSIHISDFTLPLTNNDLVIEGAGGALVPINDNEYIIDQVTKFDASVILVSNLYLGSINHTLLTLEAIKSRALELIGIIFNGPSNPSSEGIILAKAQVPCLLRIQNEENITQSIIEKYANEFIKNWY